MAEMQIPAFLLEYADKAFDEAAKAGIRAMARPAHISIETNRFNLVDEAGNSEQIREFDIEVLVVGTNPGISRIFYDPDKPYMPDTPEAPLCWSDNGVGPSSNSGEPQNPTCAGCKWSEWGSATSNISGKPVAACKEQKKLAVLYDGQIYQLVIPPNSLKHWQKYVEFVAKFPKFNLRMLRTKISFDEKTQGTLNFAAVGVATVLTQNKDGTNDMLAGFTDATTYQGFLAQLKAQGDKMLDSFTGANDKPKQGLIAGPGSPHGVQGVVGASPTQSVGTADPKREPAPREANARPNGGGTPFGGQQTPQQQAAPQQGQAPRRGRPPKSAAPVQTQTKNPFTVEPAPQASPNGQQAFGMQDTEAVEDAGVEAEVADAMGFDPSAYA